MTLPILENIRNSVKNIDVNDVNQYSCCIGALPEWIITVLCSYGGRITLFEKE